MDPVQNDLQIFGRDSEISTKGKYKHCAVRVQSREKYILIVRIYEGLKENVSVQQYLHFLLEGNMGNSIAE